MRSFASGLPAKINLETGNRRETGGGQKGGEGEEGKNYHRLLQWMERLGASRCFAVSQRAGKRTYLLYSFSLMALIFQRPIFLRSVTGRLEIIWEILELRDLKQDLNVISQHKLPQVQGTFGSDLSYLARF